MRAFNHVDSLTKSPLYELPGKILFAANKGLLALLLAADTLPLSLRGHLGTPDECKWQIPSMNGMKTNIIIKYY